MSQVGEPSWWCEGNIAKINKQGLTAKLGCKWGAVASHNQELYTSMNT